MYVDEARVAEHHELYWRLVKDFIAAAPSSLHLITKINELILKEKYYEALKLAQRLIDLEQEVIGRVTKCSEILPVG
jgi:flagellar protein FlbT